MTDRQTMIALIRLRLRLFYPLVSSTIPSKVVYTLPSHRLATSMRIDQRDQGSRRNVGYDRSSFRSFLVRVTSALLCLRFALLRACSSSFPCSPVVVGHQRILRRLHLPTLRLRLPGTPI